jgi:hypothetical protein
LTDKKQTPTSSSTASPSSAAAQKPATSAVPEVPASPQTPAQSLQNLEPCLKTVNEKLFPGTAYQTFASFCSMITSFFVVATNKNIIRTQQFLAKLRAQAEKKRLKEEAKKKKKEAKEKMKAEKKAHKQAELAKLLGVEHGSTGLLPAANGGALLSGFSEPKIEEKDEKAVEEKDKKKDHKKKEKKGHKKKEKKEKKEKKDKKMDKKDKKDKKKDKKDKKDKKKDKKGHKKKDKKDKKHKKETKDKKDKEKDKHLEYVNKAAAAVTNKESISRFAPCLAMLDFCSVTDRRCMAFRHAAELQFKSELCWVKYLNHVSRCDVGKKQNKCFKKFDDIAKKCTKFSKVSEKWFAFANAPEKPANSPPASTPQPIPESQ